MNRKLITEREMDIIVLEAQDYADTLHGAWESETQGRRAVFDLARRRKAKVPQAVAGGMPPPISSQPTPAPMTGGGYG